ncbi:putative sulfate exporter family transporter [Haloechinothrix sp. LS1_15]|uniref:YeiH family protein n=1 Tax=Haloechinothrix sp. LS1_15 TaxID=2652248 RepID=UPI0029449146|nr:putative sulfate exporter family transporter [Haloechinothrix sp. LS1_15]MDV6014692.1 putative sulfate exporter family transporter [Haloechinothrix sp. LS1_15]
MSLTQRERLTCGTTRSPVLLGLLVTGLGVGVSYLVTLAIPVVGILTAAIVLGIAAGNLPALPRHGMPGVQQATRWLLRGGIVLLGLQLALQQLLQLGAGTVLALVLTVAITFAGTLGLGRLLRVERGLSVLVATGFAICGASAVAAMASVVRRRDEDVATAIALVTLYGSLAIVAVPLLGPAFGLTGADLGAWAGLSVHEVGQVVAAAAPAGGAAVTAAVVVKLSRVLLLAPLVATMSVVERRATSGAGGRRPPIVPLFVLGFVAMVGIRATGLVPPTVLDAAELATTLLLAGALFGLGTGVRLRALLRTGPRALLLGLCSTLLIGGTAAMLVHLLA